MANDENFSKLPSGLMAGKSREEMEGAKEPKKEEAKSASDKASLESAGAEAAAMSKLPLVLGLVALLLSAAALFVSVTSVKGLSASDRAVLKDVTADLRAIQNKEITMTSPLRTTVVIDKTFPIADVLPDSFSVPLTADVPIDTTVTAQSNTGQLVPLHIKDNFKVNASIPIDVAKSYGNVMVSINKEIPIETQFSATLKVSAVYGKELNDMIEKLDRLSSSGN
ncbi:MAG: hypothetical protein V1728_01460 [Candidatus Micrarchaeota archaeon]